MVCFHEFGARIGISRAAKANKALLHHASDDRESKVRGCPDEWREVDDTVRARATLFENIKRSAEYVGSREDRGRSPISTV